MLQNNPAGELELALRIRALIEGQNAIVGLGTSFLDVNRSVEQLMLGLKSVSGSIESANSEFAFLTSVALKTGLSIDTLGQNYLKLTAAAKGTVLEGARSRELFTQVSNALMKLGSDSVNTTRAINALAQMMSKGQIYSEELKGQLAEAIPGALNIMARALDLSVQQMLNLMEQGLLTSDALVLFGNQLKTEFGSGTDSARTFNQVVNDIINKWTLLMKGIGDTGIWTALKTVMGALGTQMDLLAATAGAGLGYAFARMAIGIRGIVINTNEAVAAMATQVAANRVAASSNLDHARSSLTAAQGAQANARAEYNAALAMAQSMRGTALYDIAVKRLAAAKADLAVKTGLLIQAEQALDMAQTKMILSTTLTSRAMNVLFGPVGILVTAIGSALAFAGAFGDIGEGANASKQSLDEFSKSVNDLSVKELAASVKSIDAAMKTAIANREKLEAQRALVLKTLEQEEASKDLLYVESNLAEAHASVARNERDLAAARAEEVEQTQKLELARTAMLARLDDMQARESDLIAKSDELKKKQKELHLTTEELRKGVENGTASYSDYYAAQMREIAVNGDLRNTQIQLNQSSIELKNAERILREEAEANVDAYGGLVKGSKEYNAAVSTETTRLRERFKELSKLTEALVAAEIATRKMKAETEAFTISSKAANSAIEAEAKLLGDATAMRMAAVQQRVAEVDTAFEEIRLMEQEKASIEANLALRTRELELGTKKDKEVKEEIGRLQNVLTLKDAEINARTKLLEILRLESIEASTSSKTMTDALNDIAGRIRLIENALNDEKKAYDEALKSGKSQQELIPLYNNISTLEQMLANLSKEKAIIMKQGWQSIGQSQEEAATGMDFQTRRMISAFGELATKGDLTANQLRSSFTDVLAKANTTTELLAIGKELAIIQQTGKASTDALQLMFSELALKFQEVARNADPVTIALSKMGIDVPARLKDIADQMKSQVDLLTPQKAGIEASNQAFMKYAEALVKAKLSGADVDLQQLKVEASARGLGTAVTQLTEKLTKEHDTNKILMGSLAELKRQYELNANTTTRATEVSERYHSAKVKELDNAIRVAKAKGDEAKASELTKEKNQELIDQAYAMAVAKGREVEIAEKALSIKVLELTQDGELTLSEIDQLNALQSVVDVKRIAAQEAYNDADALAAETEATEKAAAAQRDQNDAIAQAERSFKMTAKDLNELNVSMASFQEHSAIAFGTQGVVEYGRIVDEITIAMDDANKMAERLAEEGLSMATANAETLAQALLDSQSNINDAAHAAGQNLKDALDKAKEAAVGLREELTGVAEDYTQKIFELTATEIEVMEAERDAKLAELKAKYELAGNAAGKAYEDAKNAVLQYYALKIAQEKADAEANKESETRQVAAARKVSAAWGEVGEQVAKTNKQIKTLGETDLSGLERQMNAIRESAQGLSEVL